MWLCKGLLRKCANLWSHHLQSTYKSPTAIPKLIQVSYCHTQAKACWIQLHVQTTHYHTDNFGFLEFFYLENIHYWGTRCLQWWWGGVGAGWNPHCSLKPITKEKKSKIKKYNMISVAPDSHLAPIDRTTGKTLPPVQDLWSRGWQCWSLYPQRLLSQTLLEALWVILAL